MNREQRNKYQRIKLREWRMKNRVRDLEQKKRWRDTHKEFKRQKDREYSKEKKRWLTKRVKGYTNNYLKEYLKDSEKHKKYLLRQKDNYKFRKKIIFLRKNCEVCGGSDNLEMHHKEYVNGVEQNILLLCRTHHRELHRKGRSKLEIGGIKNDI